MPSAFIEGMKTMKIKNALALTAVLMSLCSSLHALDIRIGDTRAARIAKDSHIVGKGVSGQCLPYATALHEKFQAAGIPSQVIVYGYEASAAPGVAGPSGPGRGAHAVVAYDDGGRTYIMDNQSWTPKWIHTAAPLLMAQQFSGINANVRMARVMSDETPVVSPVRTSAASLAFGGTRAAR